MKAGKFSQINDLEATSEVDLGFQKVFKMKHLAAASKVLVEVGSVALVHVFPPLSRQRWTASTSW
jgi:hypothetical protein